MNSRKEQICRLCLKMIKNGLQKVDYIMKQLFDVLLLKLDLDITSDPIICQDCVDVAKKCLNFKSVCIDTEEIILSFSAGRIKSKDSIMFIYEAKKQDVVIVSDEDLNICRFCMSRLERNNFVPLNTLLNQTMFEMITKFMPEMNFNFPEDPIICTTCRGNLVGYSRFVLICLNTETNIKTYCKDGKSDNKELIHLDSVLYFLFKNIVEYPVEYQLHKIKQEPNKTEDTEGSVRKLNIKDEEIKLNDNSYENPSEIILNEYDVSFPYKCYESDMIWFKTRGHNIEGHTYQQVVEGNMENGFIYGDDLGEKWNESSDMQKNHHIVKGDETGQGEFSGSNLMATNGAPDIDMYNYTDVVTDSKYKGNDNGNSGSERKLYQRPSYAYVHKTIAEIKMYNCALCTYETKNKSHLDRHMLVHKDASEIKMFKCALCVYEAKTESSLKRHMLVHKDVSEIEMFKCALCAYKGKTKSYLEKHMLVHKGVPETKMLKCSLCAYKCTQKKNLKIHMLVHKEISEIKMFKCALCAYEAKRKTHLTVHMLVHKDVSEIKMFKCALCAYEAKIKGLLERHMLVHKDVSDIEMFKCALCVYETKNKRCLNTHMLVHKDVSEIKMFNCALCAYKAKRKSHLTAHMLVHKDISEIKMFKCSLCGYEAKRKGHLTAHMLVHKDVLEIKMFSCSVCAFQTKHKCVLNRHMLVHA